MMRNGSSKLTMSSFLSSAESAMSMVILGGIAHERVRRRKYKIKRRHQKMMDSHRSKIGGGIGVMEGRAPVRKDLENP